MHSIAILFYYSNRTQVGNSRFLIRMDADETGLESGEYQSQDGDEVSSVPSDVEEGITEPTATLDLPAGPASPSESSSSSWDDSAAAEEKDGWRSQTSEQRGPHTPSPPRGPRTPPHEGPRTPNSPRSRSSSPDVRMKGPRTPPSPSAHDVGADIEDTPASPVASPVDSDEEEPQEGHHDQVVESEHQFATDETPFSPIESSDEDDSHDESVQKTNVQEEVDVRPPSPPMPPPDSRSQSPGLEPEDDHREDNKQDSLIRPPSPPKAESSDTNQSLKSLSQTSESVAAEEIEQMTNSPESMEQVGVRDRPPSPPSPPSESQGSDQEDASTGGNTNEEEGFARYLYRPPSPSVAGRRSPPPQVSIDTMDGIEFGDYRQKRSPFPSEPPSVLASRTQSPFHGNEPGGNGSNISETLMASIRNKTESVHIEDSNSHLGESGIPVSTSQGNDVQIKEEEQVDQSSEQQQESHRTGSDDKDSVTNEKQSDDQIVAVEPKQDDQSGDVSHNDSGDTDDIKSDKVLETDNITEGSADPADSTRPLPDIDLHSENQEFDLDELKDNTEKADKSKESEESKSEKPKAPADGSAAVVDVHHIDVHGDELDYEEDVEEHHGKETGGKEEGEEEDEEGAIDDDHDEGEITVCIPRPMYTLYTGWPD